MSGTENIDRRAVSVLQITNVEFTYLNMLSGIIEGLEKEGYLVCSAYSLGDNTDNKIKAGHKVIDISVDRRAATLIHFKTIYSIYKLIKQEKADVVHFHTPLVSFLGRIAAKAARTPAIIYTAHGFYFHDDMNPFIKGFLVFLEKAIGRIATDWIFCVSYEDALYAKEHKFQRESRIVWIGNGVDIDKFNQSFNQVAIRESLSIGTDDPVVGFIGRIVEEKGILELISAFTRVVNEIPSAKLLIIGETLSSERDHEAGFKIQKMVEDGGIKNSVIFTGYRRDIPELLSVMDLFALPSWREGLPMTIIEAMASGKPVVATNIRGSREEVVDGETGFLVPTRDPSSLEEAIFRILRNKGLAEMMGENGRKRATEIYDRQITIERQLAVYKQISREIKARD